MGEAVQLSHESAAQTVTQMAVGETTVAGAARAFTALRRARSRLELRRLSGKGLLKLPLARALPGGRQWRGLSLASSFSEPRGAPW